MNNKYFKICLLTLYLCLIITNAGAFPEALISIRDKALAIIGIDYKAAKQTAIADPDYLGNFTGHTTEHALMVSEKTMEALDSFEKAIEMGTMQKSNKELAPDNVDFCGNIDKITLVVAAICHDSGMKKGGFVMDKKGYLALDKEGRAQKATKGVDIRKNHALNSAINVLAKRSELSKLGADVDEVSLLCFAHSKSSSGIKNLCDKNDWQKAFDKIDRVVKAYNSENKEKIYFSKKKYENNNKNLGRLATAGLALRLGDVSRDSGKHAKAQNGGDIVVYSSTVNNKARNSEDEAINARVYNYRTGFVKDIFSRQVHVGEQNNLLNRTFIDPSGQLYHEMTIEDANYAPYSTFKNIMEHCGELESAPRANIKLKILFLNSIEEEFKSRYNLMRDEYYKKSGNRAIPVIYPWDGDEAGQILKKG